MVVTLRNFLALARSLSGEHCAGYEFPSQATEVGYFDRRRAAIFRWSLARKQTRGPARLALFEAREPLQSTPLSSVHSPESIISAQSYQHKCTYKSTSTNI